MRGDRTGTIGFLDELFGFEASRSGLIGIGVDIGLRNRGIIGLPPRLARLLMQQVAGPFRGRARTRTIVRVRGRDLTQDLDLPEERQPPDPPTGGCPLPVQLYANPEVQTQLLLCLVRVVRFKKK